MYRNWLAFAMELSASVIGQLFKSFSAPTRHINDQPTVIYTLNIAVVDFASLSFVPSAWNGMALIDFYVRPFARFPDPIARTPCVQVFALDQMLDLPHGASRAQLLDALQGHVLAKGRARRHYKRS